jgi:integrase
MDVHLSQLFQEYEMFKSVKGTTKAKARKAFDHLVKFRGDVAAKDVSPGWVNKWGTWLLTQAWNARTKANGLSRHTVKTTVGAAAQVFGWAMRQRDNNGQCEYGLTVNPFTMADSIKVEKLVVRYYTEEEATDILNAAAELQWCDPTKTLAWYCAVCLALECGLRKNEITNLRWLDVDLSEGIVKIRHRTNVAGQFWEWMDKGAHEGDVPLGQLGWNALMRLESVRPWLYPFLAKDRYQDLLDASWPLPESVRDNPAHNWTRDFNRILRRANRKRQADGKEIISAGDFHMLRKSLGTWLAERGVPEHYVQAALRHASPDTTRKHYVGINNKKCNEAVRAAVNTFQICAWRDSDPRPSV